MERGGSLGERVRQRRLALGLAQTELGGPGLSASYISLIEAGKRMPTEQTLQHLAERLRCSIMFLRDGVEPAAREAHTLSVVWVELALHNGEPEEVLRRASELLEDSTLAPDLRWRARRAQATAHEQLGDLETAIEVLEFLREEAEAAPAQWPLLQVVVALARCYREAGDANRSIDVAQQALATAKRFGLEDSDESNEVVASLAAAYFDRGDLVHAGLLAKELIGRVANAGTRRAQAAAYWNGSVIAQEHGHVAEALALAEKALAHLADEDQRRNFARLQLVYAGLLLRAEPPDPSRALSLISDLLPALNKFGSEVDLAYADTEIARSHLLLGDSAAAIAAAEAAMSRLGDAPRLETAESLTVLAQALLASGDAAGAATRARHAAQLLALTSAGRKPATAWAQLAEILVQAGEHGEAIRAYRRAVAAFGVPTPMPQPSMKS
jgi:transcriptional regulator with XRE-family HTH domain